VINTITNDGLELKKLNSLFPEPRFAKIIEEYEIEGISNSESVKNPFHETQTRILLSNLFKLIEKLDEQIRSVITKKINKNHSEKEQTVLIIDNRTSAFGVPEFFDAAKKLETFIDSTPFQEVWFYTGYCSNDDGNNAEFSFSPLKVTIDQEKILNEMVNKNNVDNNGRIIW
jgi:hypothetical protein